MARDVNFSEIERKIIERVTKAVDSELQGLKLEIDRNTPIDTGTLIENNKIIPAKRVGDRIVWSVYNETEYAKYVEYGVLGKTYNYHKYKRIFYSGVGARMFTRAYDRLKRSIVQKIRTAIKY